MRIFGGDQIDGVLKKLGLKENESIDHPWINKAMERAQKKVEARNFDIRKTLIKFDDVMNDQRHVIFNQRLNILKKTNIEKLLDDFLDEILKKFLKFKDEFKTSNDKEVYLTGIKTLTGNSITDDDLLNLTKKIIMNFHRKLKIFLLTKKR